MVFSPSSSEPADVKENITVKLNSQTTVKPAERLNGDINNDGKITAADARLLLRHTAKLESLDSETLKYSDANKDGRISAADARLLLRVSAKLESLA